MASQGGVEQRKRVVRYRTTLQAKRNRDFARLRDAQGRVISFTKEKQVLLNYRSHEHVAARGSSA
jgi:hypothetical protein